MREGVGGEEKVEDVRKRGEKRGRQILGCLVDDWMKADVRETDRWGKRRCESEKKGEKREKRGRQIGWTLSIWKRKEG
jgi:hypothetical protein